MRFHKLKKSGTTVGARLDVELQKVFNYLRSELNLTSNSAVVVYLAMEKYKSLVSRNMSTDNDGGAK